MDESLHVSMFGCSGLHASNSQNPKPQTYCKDHGRVPERMLMGLMVSDAQESQLDSEVVKSGDADVHE